METLTVDEFRKQFLDETLNFLNSFKMTEKQSSAESWDQDRDKFMADSGFNPESFSHIVFSQSNTKVTTPNVTDQSGSDGTAVDDDLPWTTSDNV